MINNYLQWLATESGTVFWHDSADPAEIDISLGNGARGITTNPILNYQTLNRNYEYWKDNLAVLDFNGLEPERKAERLMQSVVSDAAKKLEPEYERSHREYGYVCAQVNPKQAGDREGMLAMAKRFHNWAPNIAVKLPASGAGIDVFEEIVAQGITCTLTVSFSVAQCISIAEGYRRGIAKAIHNSVEPGKCFCVILPGRISDFFTYLVHDNEVDLSDEELHMAGVAVTKRVYSLFRERSYEAKILVAAFRNNFQITELAGGDFIISIHPKMQKSLMETRPPMKQNIENEIPAQLIAKLMRMPEFIKLYEPEGMSKNDFITSGIMQSILTNFYMTGWAMLEQFDVG